MKVSKIADKIISAMYKVFYETGDEFSYGPNWLKVFPEEPPSVVYAAIRLLESDGLISVFHADGHPQEMAIRVSAIRDIDDDTLLRRGYSALKELRSWL